MPNTRDLKVDRNSLLYERKEGRTEAYNVSEHMYCYIVLRYILSSAKIETSVVQWQLVGLLANRSSDRFCTRGLFITKFFSFAQVVSGPV